MKRGPPIQIVQALNEHIGWAGFRLGDFGEEVAATGWAEGRSEDGGDLAFSH